MVFPVFGMRVKLGGLRKSCNKVRGTKMGNTFYSVPHFLLSCSLADVDEFYNVT